MIAAEPANHRDKGRAALREKELRIALVCFGGVSLAEYLAGRGLHSSAEIVDWLAELLVAVPLTSEVRRPLIDRLDRNEKPRPLALQRLLHVLGSLPEFQLA